MNSGNFKNYEEFKELFIREDGKRKNGILLSFLKEKGVREYFKSRNIYWIFSHVNSMTTLNNVCRSFIAQTSKGRYRLSILGVSYGHPLFENINDSNGVCTDDVNKYRYISHREPDRPRVFRKKIGSLYKEIIDMSEFGALLPESVKLYLCEELTHEWVAKVTALNDRYTLVVDDDFREIYSRRNMRGDFHSCMTDRGQHTFYRDAVKARAARLLDNEDGGRMVARCVIFDECQDVETGEVLRLAERQYSSNCDDSLKRILVDRLIQGGHIDGYKKVGADCHDSRRFVGNDGADWSHRAFFIPCHLGNGDTLSYQDSFKYYIEDEERAYNNSSGIYEYDELDTTSENFHSSLQYDEYHEEYTRDDLVNVLVGGHWMTCSDEQLSSFNYVEGIGYCHDDDVESCPHCGRIFLRERGECSDITNETYCCSECRDEGEDKYKEENWYYSKYDNDYYEDEDELTTIVCDCGELTISWDSALRLMRIGRAIEDDHGTLVHRSFLQQKLERELNSLI